MDENNQLTNKSELFVNMRDYYKGIGQNPYSVLPVTYLISNTNDPDFKQFEQYYHATRNKIAEIKRQLDIELQSYYKKRANDGKTKSKRKRIENEEAVIIRSGRAFQWMGENRKDERKGEDSGRGRETGAVKKNGEENKTINDAMRTPEFAP